MLSLVSLSRISTKAEKCRGGEISCNYRIVAAEKCRAANSRNTLYFSRLHIFPLNEFGTRYNLVELTLFGMLELSKHPLVWGTRRRK